MTKLRRVVAWTFLAAIVLYAIFLVALFFMQRSMLYPGSKITVAAQASTAPGMETTRLASSAGDEVEAVFLPAFGGADGRSPMVIFTHGNGEVIDFWTTALEGFRERGIHVLLVEYPGYGRSGGSPSEKAIQAALVAGYDHFAADPRVDPARIFGFGQSIGGGAICALARERPLRALILQSTFTSLDIFTASFHAPAFLLRDRYDNLATVRTFGGPLLVIHGEQDGLIPWQQGQLLANASKQSSFKLYQCGHVCWDPERQPFWRDADRFLAEAGVISKPIDPSANFAPEQQRIP